VEDAGPLDGVASSDAVDMVLPGLVGIEWSWFRHMKHGPVSVEGAIVVGVDGTRRVTVCVPVQGVVSVARHVDAFSGMAGVVVD
jgi:hypothetical protein